MKMSCAFLKLVSFALLVAAASCSQPSTKSGTCFNKCGDPYNSNLPCQCNDDCANYGNCCADYVDECTIDTSAGTCAGRCLETTIAASGCRCDAGCVTDYSCCDDYGTLCVTTTSCSGRCLQEYDIFNGTSSCNCDDQCSMYNNCCSDYIPECASNDKCANRCFDGYDSSAPCQCNDQCGNYGNCCDDYNASCGLYLCEGKCGAWYDSSLPCQCNDGCSSYGNCCRDYNDVCATGTCEGQCGMYLSNSPCQCNDNCLTYGDCCPDYESLCAIAVEDEYYCNGECGVTKGSCSCMPGCHDDNSCCPDYDWTCEGGSKWVDDACAAPEAMGCPADFDRPPVILLSIDGFKDEYIFRHETPNLLKLGTCGVQLPYLRSVYPTKTFNNHYSIATGLYPESHGIIDNRMYDHALQEEFNLGSPNQYNSHWWGGEPIWVSASNQGRISASYFWVGSDVNITRYPDYYYQYDGSVPEEERMYQTLKWLDFPKEERPDVITLYMELVDKAGHDGGPTSDLLNQTIAKADAYVGYLMDGLKQRNLHNCVNLNIVADHGMGPISCDRINYVEDEGVDMDSIYFRSGAMGRLGPDTDPSIPFDDRANLALVECKRDTVHWQAFLKYEYLPRRLHYAYNDRIEPVHLLLDDEWLCGGRSNSYSTSSCSGGSHGWDNEFADVHAVYVAHGPGFKRNYVSSVPIENIEMYNMLAEFLEITPADNNGTAGSLNHILANPKPILPDEMGYQPVTCPYPMGSDVSDDTMGCEYCMQYSEIDANQRLNINVDQELAYQQVHLPYGVPQVHGTEQSTFCLLSHENYINAYNHANKMPSFVAFYRDYTLPTVPSITCTRPDIRLDASISNPCTTESINITNRYLYGPGLSYSNAESDATLNSNFVPMYKTFIEIWDYMTNEFNNWAGLYNGVSIITGPVFDYNYDGHADSDEIIQSQATFVDGIPVPTHVFIVATRCKDSSQAFDVCKQFPSNIDVLAYIIPNYAEQPCHTVAEAPEEWIPRALVEHVSRIRDVEWITGLSFFSDWTTDASVDQETLLLATQAKLRLPQFVGLWLENFQDGVKV